MSNNCRNITEKYIPQQGPKQACEDIVCAKCSEIQGVGDFRTCKEKCMIENQQQIIECCLERCSGLAEGIGHDDCVSSCYDTIGYRIIENDEEETDSSKVKSQKGNKELVYENSFVIIMVLLITLVVLYGVQRVFLR